MSKIVDNALEKIKTLLDEGQVMTLTQDTVGEDIEWFKDKGLDHFDTLQNEVYDSNGVNVSPSCRPGGKTTGIFRRHRINALGELVVPCTWYVDVYTPKG